MLFFLWLEVAGEDNGAIRSIGTSCNEAYGFALVGVAVLLEVEVFEYLVFFFGCGLRFYFYGGVFLIGG